jgi:hypothetical protein
MGKTEKFHVAVTVWCVRTIALASTLACAMLAGAAVSGPATSAPENSREKSAESAGYCGAKPAAAKGAVAGRTSYILGDSIGFGLQVDGLEAKLQAKLGGTSRISFDGGRSITAPGHQINKSALQSVDIDRAFISHASVIVIILGTNQLESSFVQSQQQLMHKLKTIAPRATYYWVDIGATMSNQVDGWNVRNKAIYDNADALGYSVISRYKAIFGPTADPLRIKPGQNFPALITEPGYGGVGNIHGADPALSNAILEAVSNAALVTNGCAAGA